jgi:quercetin dioxygenase-like cupin family protein
VRHRKPQESKMKTRNHGLTLAAIALAVLGPICTLNAAEPGATTATEGHERPLAISQADAGLQWGACPAIFPPGCKLSVLHGKPDQPGADVFLRVPAGYTIPAHSHTSAERMVLVSGQLDVTYAGHPKIALKRGDYAYGPAKLPHTAHCNGPEACTLFIAFNSAVDALPFAEAISKPAH